MGCCSLSGRQAGSAGTGQDEVELLKTDRTRMWSNSEGQSEASLHPQDPAILAETEDTEGLWGRTPEELASLLIAQPISGWEGMNIHSLGEIIWSSLVFLRSYCMEEMCERYIVLSSFHLLILSVDRSKRAFVYELIWNREASLLQGLKRKCQFLVIYLLLGSILLAGLVLLHLFTHGEELQLCTSELSEQGGIERSQEQETTGERVSKGVWGADMVYQGEMYPEDLPSAQPCLLMAVFGGCLWILNGLLPLAGMRLREIAGAISHTFEISGSMIESRLICCQSSADFDMWVQHLRHQIETANAHCPASPNNNISFLVPCDEQWKKKELMRHLLCNTILQWEGKPIQHLGRIQYLTMVQVATGCMGDCEERLLILFTEDLLFLSVDKDRTAITYKGKLPLTGIQAKEKSTMLGRLQFEITGSFTEPILITCSTAEDYERCLFYLQKPEKILDPPTLQPPPMIPKKCRQYQWDISMQ